MSTIESDESASLTMSDKDQIKLLEAHLRARISALEVERARVDAEQKRIDADLAQYQRLPTELTRIGTVVHAPPVAAPDTRSA